MGDEFVLLRRRDHFSYYPFPLLTVYGTKKRILCTLGKITLRVVRLGYHHQTILTGQLRCQSIMLCKY